jgi:HEAT repeat protein
VRGAAAYALGRLGDRRMLSRMVKALEDASDWVKISAARGLGLLGDPAARKPLDKALMSPNREVAAAVQDALDALAD